MFPSPVQTMLLDLGRQLAPFAFGCVVFTGVVLVGMFAAMFADVRRRRPAATRPIAIQGEPRPLAA